MRAGYIFKFMHGLTTKTFDLFLLIYLICVPFYKHFLSDFVHCVNFQRKMINRRQITIYRE